MDVPPDLVHAELASYLADAADPVVQPLPTRCRPWTVHDLTAHLAQTFARFNRLLAQSRAGDLTPPFPPQALKQENLDRVAAFRADGGDPIAALEREARAFLADVGDQDELIAHQFGPLPLRVQLGFALNELTIHHDDLATAKGERFTPSDEVVAMLVEGWRRLGPLPIPEPGDTDWTRILRASGR